MMQSKGEAMIIGGASNKTFQDKGIKKFLKQENADYLLINPINTVPDVHSIFYEILEIKADIQKSLFNN